MLKINENKTIEDLTAQPLPEIRKRYTDPNIPILDMLKIEYDPDYVRLDKAGICEIIEDFLKEMKIKGLQIPENKNEHCTVSSKRLYKL